MWHVKGIPGKDLRSKDGFSANDMQTYEPYHQRM